MIRRICGAPLATARSRPLGEPCEHTILGPDGRCRMHAGVEHVAARTLVADPPWRFRDTLPGKGRGAAKHYPTLSLDEIAAFPLPPLAEDAWLFLWRPAAFAFEAFAVMEAWGFEYASAELAWVKINATPLGGLIHMGMGRTVRNAHEDAIIGRRGRPEVQDHGVPSVVLAPVSEHSRKPDQAMAAIERFGDSPFVELFARRRRPGWSSYGNEIGREVPA